MLDEINNNSSVFSDSELVNSIKKSNKNEVDVHDDANLRPNSLENYIGQKRLKDQIKMMVSSAHQRQVCLDHLLFFGLPGMGKTTIAQIIANEMKTHLVVTSGQALEKTGDVASILAALKPGDVLFIDEIHRLRPKVEEMLYTAMEDFAIDLVLGKGPTAKVMRLDLAKFTLVGATTKLNKLANPLRDRFGMIMQLEDYEQEDIVSILKINSSKLEIKAEDKALELLAVCSRGTPRVAIHFLKRARDFLLHEDKTILTETMAQSLLQKIGLDLMGLSVQDRKLIQKIYYDFNNGPVGLSTLAAAVNEDASNLEDMVEPFLIRLGLLQRTHRGRQLTHKGVELAKTLDY